MSKDDLAGGIEDKDNQAFYFFIMWFVEQFTVTLFSFYTHQFSLKWRHELMCDLNNEIFTKKT